MPPVPSQTVAPVNAVVGVCGEQAAASAANDRVRCTRFVVMPRPYRRGTQLAKAPPSEWAPPVLPPRPVQPAGTGGEYLLAGSGGGVYNSIGYVGKVVAP